MSNRTKRIAFLVRRIFEQKDWIKKCEDSGVSYTNTSPSSVTPGLTRGDAIRKADRDELDHLFAELTRERDRKPLRTEARKDDRY